MEEQTQKEEDFKESKRPPSSLSCKEEPSDDEKQQEVARESLKTAPTVVHSLKFSQIQNIRQISIDSIDIDFDVVIDPLDVIPPNFDDARIHRDAQRVK